MLPLVSREMMPEKQAQKFHTDDASLPRTGKCFWLHGHAAWKICSNQSEALPRSGQWCIISMEFLHLFLRSHFAGKPGEASWNVGYFLTGYMLLWIWNLGSNLFKVLTFQDAMCWAVVNTDTGSCIHLIMLNQQKWVHVLFKIHCRSFQCL